MPSVLLAHGVTVLELPPSTQLWSSVYNFYWILGLIAGFATFGIMMYFLLKYRSKSDREVAVEKQKEDRENWRGPLILFLLMAIILVAVAIQTLSALPVYQTPPKDQSALRVDVIAHQFFFNFQYANNKSSPGELVVPVGTVIVMNVTSADVYHQFGIPFFRVKTDAIPGRYNIVWIKPPDIGNYTIQCYELCGVGHATMINKLVVLPMASFLIWYKAGGGL
jgi:cytochrome c oxidase subunit 2